MVSGESGAGKTESTRRVLEYLVKTSSRLASSYGGAAAAAGHLQNKLLQSNPLLETLGNAKTMRNDNSSRFGKFIQVYFDATGAIAGGTVRTRPRTPHSAPAPALYCAMVRWRRFQPVPHDFSWEVTRTDFDDLLQRALVRTQQPPCKGGAARRPGL